MILFTRRVMVFAAIAVILAGSVFTATAEAQRRGRSGGRSGRSFGGASRSGGSSFRRSGGSRFGSSRSSIRRSGGSRFGSGRSSFRRSGGSSFRRSGGSSYRRSSGRSSYRRSSGNGSYRRSTGRSVVQGRSSSGYRSRSRSTFTPRTYRSRSTTPRTTVPRTTRRSTVTQRFSRSGGSRGRGTGTRSFTPRTTTPRNITGRSRSTGSRGRTFVPNFNSRRSSRSFGGRSFRRSNAFRSRWLVGGSRYYGGRSRRGFLRNSWGLWLSNGYGGWGLGLGIGSGYFGNRYFDFVYTPPIRTNYYNPYCQLPGYSAGVTPVYDYSQPVSGGGTANEAGVDEMVRADEAFRKGDYETALAEVKQAVKQMPKNSDVHQFHSLVLFALKRYPESAAAAHAALAGGKGWNWATLRSFYDSKETYTAQLRALEAYRSEDKENLAGRFLLGYHYLMLGHSDAAAKELAAVVQLEPRDTLSAELLKAISKKTGKDYTPQKATPEEAPKEPKQPDTKPKVIPQVQPPKPPLATSPKNEDGGQPDVKPPVPPKSTDKVPEKVKPVGGFKLPGTWKAKSPDGAEVTLQLKGDGTFRWSVKAGGQTTNIDGTYTLQKGQLKLTSEKEKEALEGTLTTKDKNEFVLKLKWQPQDEPGLTFKRQ